MERLHKSMTGYTKSLSKRNEGDDKEKTLPVSYLGSTMIGHGEEFEGDSEFGNCLIGTSTPKLHSRINLHLLMNRSHGPNERKTCSNSRDLRQ
jgi:hypothetical protein